MPNEIDIPRCLVAGLASLLIGCDGTASCLGFGYSVTPRDTIVSVGSTFTPQVRLLGCPPEGLPQAEDFRWSTEGTEILEVAETSGQIQAIGVGTARVVGVGPAEQHFLEVQVTVEP